MEITVDEMKAKAISYMEDFLAYHVLKNINRALVCRGKAAVYEEMLLDQGIDLTEEDEHYERMYNIWLQYK